MTVSRVVPIFRVSDMAAALAFYGRLGFVIDFEHAATPAGPWYAGVSLDGVQIHLSTFGGDSVPGAAVYFHVDDGDALFRQFIERGLKTPRKPDSPVEDGPVDQTWGMREFYVRDPDGNALRFGSPLRTLFEAVGGADGVRRLAHAWHTRVLADEVVAHAFSHGFHPQHTERLAAYWSEAWGGPSDYTAKYGSESSVVRMHSGNGQHDEMDRRAIACFDQALDDVGVVDPLRQVLHDYFAWTTTTTMTAYPKDAGAVPDDLRLPRWSWNGRQV